MKLMIRGVVALAAISFALAEDAKRDPGALATESAQRAAGFFEEIKGLEERLAKTSGAEAEKLKKFIELTRGEAESTLKASKAWSNNQLRLAERHAEKAGEYCEKRGRMIAEIYPDCAGPKPEGEKAKKAPEKSDIEKLEQQLESLGKPQ